MYDREKMKYHTSEEGFNPGYIVGTFKRLLEELKEITSMIYTSKAMRMSKERYQNSQDYLKAYEKTMLAYSDIEPIGRLTTDQQRKILVMIDDVLKGKRECVQFQLNRSCNGLKEVFSNTEFFFDNETSDK
ncbi:hypothetical protein [Algoriphagus limi]|uniref:Four helix bundle protein n=1 Tax=Algoriphagus limi TaxID=2975273 RepID=A0ABT2G909_9BACT|nr:hypothetical protein [Algoriphagus limi]MCS5491762.1 hypothetical protein [Algoriphagus limi]